MSSKLGILIAVGVVLAVGVAVAIFVVFPPHSDPTAATMKQGVLDMVDVDASPALVLGGEMTDSGNAGDDYKKAIELYKADKEAIEQTITDIAADRSIPANDLRHLEKVNALMTAASKKSQMDFTAVYFAGLKPKLIQPCEADLTDLVLMLDHLAFYYESKGNKALAQQALRNKFALGYHLVKERGVLGPVWHGLDYQQQAINQFREAYGEWGDAYKKALDNVNAYEQSEALVYSHFNEKLNAKILNSTKPNPGDVFNIVENDKDRSWRVQGILTLGILKYTAGGSRGDIRYTNKLIKQFLNSSDPYEKAAAQVADGLTQEGFNQETSD